MGGDAVRSFRVPECWACGGVLKPEVVFFGESVPAEWVEEAWHLHEAAQVLLVVGSSLAVFSGRRFVYRAVEEALPVAVVNLGPTRADESARVKVEARAGDVLPRLAGALEAAAIWPATAPASVVALPTDPRGPRPTDVCGLRS